jgi:DNA polymerase III subunit gamma/tau
MSTEVWYRKWRPQRFAEVAGQEHVTRTLANAVAGGRIAHAYLFCGPRGTGKTTTARVLAKAANCRQNSHGEPCNRCSSCIEVAEGRALDLVEMDAASNRGIDEIRSLRDRVGYSPTSSAYKVYLIDEVHELTAFAFDALLKTLEEPPPHVIFVLATTDADRVPATVASRCQRFDFRRIRLRDVVGRLRQICEAEDLELPDAAFDAIARKATGSLRDAVNLLEQVMASCGNRPSLEDIEQAFGAGSDVHAAAIVRHALTRDLAAVFNAIAVATDDGVEPRQLQRAMQARLRALLFVKAGAAPSLDLGEEALTELRAEADPAEIGAVVQLLDVVSAADFRTDALSSLPLELAIAKVVLGLRTPSAQVLAAEPAKAEPAAGHSLPPRPRPVPEPAHFGEPADLRPPRPAAPPARPQPPPEIVPFPAVRERTAATPAAAEHWSAVIDSEDLTLTRLQELMGSVYDRLKERRSRAAPFFNSYCNAVALEGDAITLAFKHDVLAARIKSEEGGKHLRDIADVIQSLCGRRFRLEVRVDPDVQRWVRPAGSGRTSHLLDEAERLGLRRETE